MPCVNLPTAAGPSWPWVCCCTPWRRRGAPAPALALAPRAATLPALQTTPAPGGSSDRSRCARRSWWRCCGSRSAALTWSVHAIEWSSNSAQCSWHSWQGRPSALLPIIVRHDTYPSPPFCRQAHEVPAGSAPPTSSQPQSRAAQTTESGLRRCEACCIAESAVKALVEVFCREMESPAVASQRSGQECLWTECMQLEINGHVD